MLQIFGIISAILYVLLYVPYIWDIFRLKTKPERASWLIWSILAIIAFFTQTAIGASASLWFSGTQVFLLGIVFLLSIKFGVGGLNKKDILALLFSILGLIIWYFTREAAFALYITIFVDAIGVILTVQKAYLYPESETLLTWILGIISPCFAALAVGKLNLVLLSWPIYSILLASAVVFAIYMGRRKVYGNN